MGLRGDFKTAWIWEGSLHTLDEDDLLSKLRHCSPMKPGEAVQLYDADSTY
jgi:hypothetical protein